MTTCPATHPLCQHRRATDMRHYGCTCDLARADRARRMKASRLRRARGTGLRVLAIGTQRRIQALQVIGWRQGDIAARLGWHQQEVGQILTDRRYVYSRTAAAVARVYDDLADTPGPSARTTSRAKASSWLGPLWWDDDTIDDPTFTPDTTERWGRDSIDPVAVELTIAGRARPNLTIAERAEAVRRLHARGGNDQDIAERIGMSDRNVLRIRQRLNLPANTPAAGAA